MVHQSKLYRILWHRVNRTLELMTDHAFKLVTQFSYFAKRYLYFCKIRALDTVIGFAELFLHVGSASRGSDRQVTYLIEYGRSVLKISHAN